MAEKFVICKLNEKYLEAVKKQMVEQKMPLPADDSQITIAHKPVAVVEAGDLCDCRVCSKLKGRS